MLAGLSADYYTRLEQGRDDNPSDQVLAALARALQLDPAATEYLFKLAHPRACVQRTVSRADQVSLRVLRFIEKWDDASVFVVNRRLDILAKNRVATALFEEVDYTDNLIRLGFLNPAARQFWLNWEEEAAANVAHLRAVAGPDRDDPYLLELVDEISRESEEFRRLWARHDVRGRNQGLIRLHHSEVGELTFSLETLRIESAPGLRILVAEAVPRGPADDVLAKLHVLATSRQ
ncbi:helix-turn-helix transcriptional regulator [Planotetraspora kaengkrachanensis]|uniref:Transcriptional regulator n=2 Tax=Planotetraspora kaengkrachanensis TaxID=575193 RepID=A0A8J3LTR0_9ACTN|nr:transcriptional regulator [Planotetraspora kaengkrachanensis]